MVQDKAFVYAKELGHDILQHLMSGYIDSKNITM